MIAFRLPLSLSLSPSSLSVDELFLVSFGDRGAGRRNPRNTAEWSAGKSRDEFHLIDADDARPIRLRRHARARARDSNFPIL